jgi:hypothetical protein
VDSSPLNMETIGCPETSVRNYHYSLRNDPEERSSLLLYYLYRCVYQSGTVVSRYSDSLRAGRSRDRNPVAVRFSARVQTGPGAHPASYTMGTGSFPGVKRPGRGVDHPPHLVPRLKKE